MRAHSSEPLTTTGLHDLSDGTKEPSTTATKRSPETTVPTPVGRLARIRTTPSSRNSRSSFETSRPPTTSSLTERPYSTTLSSFSSIREISSRSTSTFLPKSALPLPICPCLKRQRRKLT